MKRSCREWKRLIADEKGMTLLELSFAAGVSSLALVMLFGTLINITSSGSINEQRQIAVTHLTTVFEDLADLPLPALLEYQPTGFTGLGANERIAVYAITSASNTLVQLPAVGTNTSTWPNPVPIRVIISWADDQGRPMAIETTRLYFIR